MLEQILRHLNNWFWVRNGIHAGEFNVQDGRLTLPFLQTGQYFRVIGSVFNDGVYQYPASDMTDEVFDGAVWALAIPKSFLDLVGEIEAWQEKNGDSANSPFSSESFGGYSYSKSTDPTTGGAVTWETAFRKQLNQWRKI